jgi:hypothetical protein
MAIVDIKTLSEKPVLIRTSTRDPRLPETPQTFTTVERILKAGDRMMVTVDKAIPVSILEADND